MIQGKVQVDKNKCLRCGGCVAVCPQSALRLTEHGITCDGDRCNTCKICVEFCPVGALTQKEGEEE